MSNRRKKKALQSGAVDWKKAARSFRRILNKNSGEFRRLCDARTYRQLEREDGI